MRNGKFKVIPMVVLACAVILMSVIGCAEAQTTTTTTPAATTTTAAKSDKLLAFEKKIKGIYDAALVEKTLPLPMTGPKALGEHKTIMFVVNTMEDSTANMVSQQVKKACKVLGWDLILVDSKMMDVSIITNSFEQAVANKVDGVLSWGLDPQATVEGGRSLKKAGIPWTGMYNSPPKGPVKDENLFQMEVVPPTLDHTLGYMRGVNAFMRVGPPLRFIGLDFDFVQVTVDRHQGFVDFVEEAQAAGADVKILQQDVMQTHETTAITAHIAPMIARNPDYNVITCMNDASAVTFVNELKTIGKYDPKKKIYANDNSPDFIADMRQGGMADATVATSYLDAIGWMSVDNYNRFFQGEPYYWTGQNIDVAKCLYDITADNIPPTDTYHPNYDPEKLFRQMWGL